MSLYLPSAERPLRIGSRGSPLALAQAHEARARLMAAHGLAEAAFEVVVIRTSGDRITDRPLSEAGGKGLFTKEIEEALIAGAIDLAVHSMKDLPTLLPAGLEIACLLPREDPRDAFVSLAHESLAMMPAGSVVGTSSLRRGAQVLHRHPGLRVVGFRGNVQTRLRKLEEGVAEATFLAAAGLKRLGREAVMRAVVEPEEMLPAVSQGAIGLEIRASDEAIAALLAPIHDAPTAIRVAAERAFLAGLDGSCRTPIAGLADITGETLRLRGEIIRPDGSERLATERRGPPADAAAMGADAARELRGRGGPGFFDG